MKKKSKKYIDYKIPALFIIKPINIMISVPKNLNVTSLKDKKYSEISKVQINLEILQTLTIASISPQYFSVSIVDPSIHHVIVMLIIFQLKTSCKHLC